MTLVMRRLWSMGCTLLVVLACGGAFSGTALAGSACEPMVQTADSVANAFRLAAATQQAAEQADASVLIVGRIGSDLSAYRLRYSHAGLLFRDHPQGRWLFVHALNQCATERSDLFDEGLANFFLDGIHQPEALLLAPPPAVQARLLAMLRAGQLREFHHPQYSMIAYHQSTRYQNSNQWLLEVLAAALAEPGAVRNRQEAQRWLRDAAYQPGEIQVGVMKRLGARLFSANVSFDDHPDALRAEGRFHVVTVESIQQFLASRQQMVQQSVVSCAACRMAPRPAAAQPAE